MDCVVFNKNKQKEYKKNELQKSEYKKLVEENLEELFGCSLIASDYLISEESNLKIDALGIDDNYQLVVFEYKLGKFSKLINKGLMIIDYINEHLSEFKILINDLLKEEARNVMYLPRLVVVGDSFHKYDGYSISKLPYNIELINVNLYNKDLVLIEKKHVSRNVDVSGLKYRIDGDIKYLFDELVNFLVSLGDEVTLFANGNVVFVRKIKTFMYIVFEEGLNIFMNNKMKQIKSIKDLEKAFLDIEKEYDKR